MHKRAIVIEGRSLPQKDKKRRKRKGEKNPRSLKMFLAKRVQESMGFD